MLLFLVFLVHSPYESAPFRADAQMENLALSLPLSFVEKKFPALRPNLPPGTAAAWRKLLSYTGSCYRRDMGTMDVLSERLRDVSQVISSTQQTR